MTLAWLYLYAFAIGRAGDVLAPPTSRRALDGVAGVVLVAFGVRLASQQR